MKALISLSFTCAVGLEQVAMAATCEQIFSKCNCSQATLSVAQKQTTDLQVKNVIEAGIVYSPLSYAVEGVIVVGAIVATWTVHSS